MVKFTDMVAELAHNIAFILDDKKLKYKTSDEDKKLMKFQKKWILCIHFRKIQT